ncbi:uncharacterized protein Dvar_36540 [Desulfosarcina variabilis str. Montpellier]
MVMTCHSQSLIIHFPFFNYPLNKGACQMTESDDQTLKAEIDEIMNQVDAIMEKVARVIPKDEQETDGQE